MYVQASIPINNTRKVLKIKENFPNLQAKKIKNIQKIINNNGKIKLRLHMTTKELLRKYIIVPISNNNKNGFMFDSSTHIENINSTLKNIKLKVKANFIQAKQVGIIIVTNKITASLDLQTIEQYIKSANQIEAENDEVSYLSQSKSYLKIISIPYLLENANTLIMLDMIETIIKNNYIFNNIAIALKPRVIKILSRSDMAII